MAFIAWSADASRVGLFWQAVLSFPATTAAPAPNSPHHLCLQACSDSRSIGAEIVVTEAGRRPHVDARPLTERGYADHDVVAEPHNRRACHRFDHAIAPSQCRLPRIADVPLAFCNQRQRGVIGDLGWDSRDRAERRRDRPSAEAPLPPVPDSPCVRVDAGAPGRRSVEDSPCRS